MAEQPKLKDEQLKLPKAKDEQPRVKDEQPEVKEEVAVKLVKIPKENIEKAKLMFDASLENLEAARENVLSGRTPLYVGNDGQKADWYAEITTETTEGPVSMDEACAFLAYRANKANKFFGNVCVAVAQLDRVAENGDTCTSVFIAANRYDKSESYACCSTLSTQIFTWLLEFDDTDGKRVALIDAAVRKRMKGRKGEEGLSAPSERVLREKLEDWDTETECDMLVENLLKLSQRYSQAKQIFNDQQSKQEQRQRGLRHHLFHAACFINGLGFQAAKGGKTGEAAAAVFKYDMVICLMAEMRFSAAMRVLDSANVFSGKKAKNKLAKLEFNANKKIGDLLSRIGEVDDVVAHFRRLCDFFAPSDTRQFFLVVEEIKREEGGDMHCEKKLYLGLQSLPDADRYERNSTTCVPFAVSKPCCLSCTLFFFGGFVLAKDRPKVMAISTSWDESFHMCMNVCRAASDVFKLKCSCGGVKVCKCVNET